MKRRSGIDTKLALGTALFLILILFLISGFLGLYSLKNSYTETSGYIEAVNLARQSELFFQNQFYIWKIAILQGNEFKEYKRNYHSFTFFADRVQDSLFNLKLLCKDMEGVADGIRELKKLHMTVTREYTVLIMNSADTGFKNRIEVFSLSKDKEKLALVKMDEIVRKIEEEANAEVARINEYYFNLVFVSLFVIGVIVISMGLYFSYKLLRMQNELESTVRERTAELAKANAELEKEIGVRTKAVELLKNAKEESEEARKRISVSEKKYRLLVEESNDIIFSLDEDYNFLSANRAISTHLKVRPSSVCDINFIDLLCDGSNGRATAKQLIREKLEIFSREREPVEFIADFNSSFASEPKEMRVKMEYIKAEGKNEIHGIASPLTEDKLIKYFVHERQKFVIGNYLVDIEDITYRMTRNLLRYIDANETSFIRIGLREMIINAIEHGNLEITYEEKTKAMRRDAFLELFEQRRNDPALSKRRVEVEYQVDSTKALYRITDQGKGFNHKAALENDFSHNKNEVIPHGRGIMMSKEIFDEIKYNERGNQVMLIKYFSSHSNVSLLKSEGARSA